ncbi:MAG: DUF2312 domain-containing protein [Pseudomonadota bacterium]
MTEDHYDFGPRPVPEAATPKAPAKAKAKPAAKRKPNSAAKTRAKTKATTKPKPTPKPTPKAETPPEPKPQPETVNRGGVAGGKIRAFVERIERLEDEKKGIAEDIKDVYAEAKSDGFDTKVLRKLVGIRKQDPAERQEEESLLDIYMHALGMTPLEKAIAGDEA